MAINSDSATILLLSNNPSLVESTRTALEKDKSLAFVLTDVGSPDLIKAVSENQPDVILLDFDFHNQPFYLSDKLAAEFPSCAVIAILPEEELIHSDRVILSGARAFIKYPYEPSKLVQTITRVLELMTRNRVSTEQTKYQDSVQFSNADTEIHLSTNLTYTLFSPKGGVGCTSIAINLAITLQKLIKSDLLLVDAKPLFGHVPLFLNLMTGNSITDLIAQAGMLDHQLANQVLVKHQTGIDVLPSAKTIEEVQEIKPENLYKVTQFLQGLYPVIIIDGGSSLNENIVTFLDSSDRILLVINPDLASMRDARKFLDFANTLGYPPEKVLLILNQANRELAMKSSEIEDILKIKIFSKIPADQNMSLNSLNEGIPVVVKKPRHAISKSMAALAKELIKISPK